MHQNEVKNLIFSLNAHISLYFLIPIETTALLMILMLIQAIRAMFDIHQCQILHQLPSKANV